MGRTDPAIAVGRVIGGLGALAGMIASLAMLGAFGPLDGAQPASNGGTGTVRSEAGIDYLAGDTLGNAPVLFFWGVTAAIAALLVVYGIRSRNLALLWGLATGLSLLAVLGVWSIGWLVAPFAALTLLSAIFMTLGARTGAPPTDLDPIHG